MTPAPKPQLHVSALTMLYRCGVQYEFRYIRGERRPPSREMLAGSGAHVAVERDLRAKLERGALLADEEIRDAARDGTHAAWVRTGVAVDPGEDVERVRGTAIDEAVSFAALHHARLAPRIEPIAVERRWVVEAPGLPFDLAGTIDIQERGRIRDTKTSRRSPKRDAADASEQLSVYALAATVLDGGVTPEVVLDHVVITEAGNASVVTQRSTRDAAALAVQGRRLERAARVIEAGAFAPADPSSWWCSARWCGYWSACDYARRPVRVSLSV